MIRRAIAATLLSILSACAARRAQAPAPLPSTLVRGATVIDGTGAPARVADVRIVGDRIAAVGALPPTAGERVIDAGGLVLAPGFIDTHSHYDRGAFEHRDALAAVSQGITTAVVGQDGSSPEPSIAAFLARLDREPAAINFATYTGHGSARLTAMGQDYKRVATSAERARMAEIVRADMAAGALGLSTGLEYDPGIYSDRAEVQELARVAAAAGGRYISHVRSEDRAFWPAVDELIAIGRATGAPVQLSHAKLAMRSLWGGAPALLDTLDRARAAGVEVTADVYPYTFWQSTLTVMFPERNYDDSAAVGFALREVASPDGLLLGRFAPDSTYVGKTVAQIAALRGTPPGATLTALIHEAEAWERAHGEEDGESVIATSMSDDDVARLLAWPNANVCTDGELAGRHPRGFGSFPRVLGRYVRERRVMSWEEAIRKMTSGAATHVGLAGRGTIAPGQAADLVLLDTARVIDRATPQEPQAVSDGIVRTWVNGVVVWENGRTTGAHPGRALRRRN
jgi:N-acyl-D-amino-acid deacylase